MPASPGRLRIVAAGTVVFALTAIATGGTLAASTNPATLYACYNAYGQVAMSDVAQCRLSGGGRLVYWGTTPLPGPTGAAGPVGATGAAGPTGPAGVAGSLATTSVTLPATSTPYLASLGTFNGVYLQAECVDTGTPSATVAVANFTGADLSVMRSGSSTVYTITDHHGLDLVAGGQETLTAFGALGPFTAIVMAIPVAGIGCVFTVAH